ncbi:MAG: hypothetical protein KDL87_15090, partial [Verrucomicrobiae bacterium]|nr:hypothetical protein [Verrucomicrobiae bacterium]
DYRGSAIGLYTIYYDAIAPVKLFPPSTSSGGDSGVFVPPVVIPEPVVVPLPFNFLPFLWVDKFDSYDRDDLWLNNPGDYYLEGVGLVSRLLMDEEGEPGVGAYYESEAVESLAEILGFPVDETDEKEEDDQREERGAAFRQIGGLHGIYWQYQPFTGDGHYSSNTVFGTPGL